MDELTDGKATEGGDYGRFCWDGQLYHCIHVQGADSFIPGFCSVGGGVLWLELEGNCRADNGTGGQIGMFGGFDTVVITGTTVPNCIRATVFDAISLDYNTVLLEDCCSSVTEEIQRVNMDCMAAIGAVVSDSAAFLEERLELPVTIEQVRQEIRQERS